MISIKTLTVHNENDNIAFGENNINVSLQDDAGGYFIRLECNMTGSELNIDFNQVDEVFQAIKQLQKQIENIK